MLTQLILLAAQLVFNCIMKTGLGVQPKTVAALLCAARNSLSFINVCPSGVFIVLAFSLWVSESASPQATERRGKYTKKPPSQIKFNPVRTSSSIFQQEKNTAEFSDFYQEQTSLVGFFFFFVLSSFGGHNKDTASTASLRRFSSLFCKAWVVTLLQNAQAHEQT